MVQELCNTLRVKIYICVYTIHSKIKKSRAESLLKVLIIYTYRAITFYLYNWIKTKNGGCSHRTNYLTYEPNFSADHENCVFY